MGTSCAPLITDVFLFCDERAFMAFPSFNKETEIFKHLPQQLDNLLHIDNPYFEGMVGRIYPPAQKLNKANASDTEAKFLN